jgi:hypothetical protein
MGYESHTEGQGAVLASEAVSEDVRAVLESLEEFAALSDTLLWDASGERYDGVVVEQEELQWWARVFRRVARATAAPDAAGDAGAEEQVEAVDRALIGCVVEGDDAVVLYEMPTGPWHRLLGMVRGGLYPTLDDARRAAAGRGEGGVMSQGTDSICTMRHVEDLAAASRRIATLERQRAILGEAVADAVKWIHGGTCLTNPAGCVCTQFIKALADVAALEAE